MRRVLALILLLICGTSISLVGCCAIGSAELDFTKWGTGESGFLPRNDERYSDGVPTDLRKKTPWWDAAIE
jgi:hypothetical protein